MSTSGVSSGYRYSYSGTDARAYTYFEGRGDIAAQLESLHTISWSVNEAQGPARSFGYRGVRGFAGAIRTIAGSLITIVVEDNPLASLMDMMDSIKTDPALHWPNWSIDWEDIGVGSGLDNTDFSRRLAPLIPPFNILVQLVAEGSQWTTSPADPLSAKIPGAAYLLKNVRFINEGMVTSVSDAYTEVTFSWVAEDVKTLSNQQFDAVLKQPFTPSNELTSKADQLKALILDDRAQREQIYKTQTNEIFGPDNTSPFSGIV